MKIDKLPPNNSPSDNAKIPFVTSTGIYLIPYTGIVNGGIANVSQYNHGGYLYNTGCTNGGLFINPLRTNYVASTNISANAIYFHAFHLTATGTITQFYIQTQAGNTNVDFAWYKFDDDVYSTGLVKLADIGRLNTASIVGQYKYLNYTLPVTSPDTYLLATNYSGVITILTNSTIIDSQESIFRGTASWVGGTRVLSMRYNSTFGTMPSSLIINPSSFTFIPFVHGIGIRMTY